MADKPMRLLFVVAGATTLLVFTGLALAATKTKTYSSGNISKGLGGGTTVVQTLNVKQKGTIKDLDVGVALDTNENDDFAFLLMSPKGKAVHLSSGNGGSGSGYGSDCTASEITTFDDEAAQDIQDYEGVDHVFDGVSYKPEQYDSNSQSGGLSAMDGKQIHGKWRLVVIQTEDTGGGALKCFKLTAKYKPKKL
jgi:subtilisin-like proprotein convertase family protein